MLTSFYGSYYYAVCSPYLMYFLACSGWSVYFASQFFSYQTTISLSVADASLKSDGEKAIIILYDGRIYDVLIKNMNWFRGINDRLLVKYLDEKGKTHGFVFDFSKRRRSELIDKELCMAIIHPDVHRIQWNN